MAKQVKIGHTDLKPGDRVVQSNSIHFFSPNTEGFPWEVVETWCSGEMVKLRFVGSCGTKDGGYANARRTYDLVKMEGK